MEDISFLFNFVKEQSLAGTLSKETADKIQELWNNYKEPQVLKDCAIITAEFGKLGSVVVRNISDCEVIDLKYEKGSYDFVTIISDGIRRILWTDYENIEPYNRQGGLYADGAAFDMLGYPIYSHKEYREFDKTHKYSSNISFGIWGFQYNDFYGSVRFGLSIKKEKVDEFIFKLRVIIDKVN